MCSSFFQNGEQINLSHKWNSRSLPHTDIHTAIHIFLALLSWKKYLPLNQHVIFHICNSAEWFYWIVSMSKNMQLSYNLVPLVQLYNFVHISSYPKTSPMFYYLGNFDSECLWLFCWNNQFSYLRKKQRSY